MYLKYGGNVYTEFLRTMRLVSYPGLCTREKNPWLVGWRVPPVSLFWRVGLWVYTRHPCQFLRVPGHSTGRVCVLYNYVKVRT